MDLFTERWAPRGREVKRDTRRRKACVGVHLHRYCTAGNLCFPRKETWMEAAARQSAEWVECLVLPTVGPCLEDGGRGPKRPAAWWLPVH